VSAIPARGRTEGLPGHGRHEAKYLVSEALAEAVQRHASPWIQADPHARRSPECRYRIESLYLDTVDYRLYGDTLDGAANRFKLRIRSYGDASIRFLEVKHKHGSLVRKERQRVTGTLGEVLDRLAGGIELHTFGRHVVQLGARPVVHVGYWRQAFIGSWHDSTRLTLDRGLEWADPELAGDVPAWQPIPENRVVLELKFDGSMPFWMQDVVRRFGLRRTACSKYALAVRAARARTARVGTGR
jgi:hypothetical protein